MHSNDNTVKLKLLKLCACDRGLNLCRGCFMTQPGVGMQGPESKKAPAEAQELNSNDLEQAMLALNLD